MEKYRSSRSNCCCEQPCVIEAICIYLDILSIVLLKVFVVNNNDSESLHFWNAVPVEKFDCVAPLFLFASVRDSAILVIGATVIEDF